MTQMMFLSTGRAGGCVSAGGLGGCVIHDEHSHTEVRCVVTDHTPVTTHIQSPTAFQHPPSDYLCIIRVKLHARQGLHEPPNPALLNPFRVLKRTDDWVLVSVLKD